MANSSTDFTHISLDEMLSAEVEEAVASKSNNAEETKKNKTTQHAKYNSLADQLGVQPGSRVLEMGCSGSSFISFVNENRKAKTISLAASYSQYHDYIKNGLSVYIKDNKIVRRADFGIFDALIAINAFEELCSVEACHDGKQEKIYQHFFKNAADLVSAGGRFYLQTWVLNGVAADQPVHDGNDMTSADRNLYEAIKRVNLCLPCGCDMVIGAASPYFKVISTNSDENGDLETINCWKDQKKNLPLKKTKSFFKRISSMHNADPLQACLERGLVSNFRIVLEKKVF